MKTRLSVLALALGVITLPASAAFLDKVAINIGAIAVMPDESSGSLNAIESVAGLSAGSTSVAVDNNTQLGLTIDYAINSQWSLELVAATPFSHGINVKGSAIDGLAIGKTKHLPPTLLLQYHFASSNSRFDPFVGVGVNYTQFFSEKADAELVGALQSLGVTSDTDKVDLSLKESVGLALQLGANYKIADNWGVYFMLSQMDIGTTARVKVNGTTVQKVDVDIDPLVTMLGVRWQL